MYLFDVPTKTYIAADSTPYDENNFEAVSEYLSFLVQFSELYRSLGETIDVGRGGDSGRTGTHQAEKSSSNGDELRPRFAASAARLSSDTTLGFHQVNAHLALAYVVRTDIHTKNAGMIVSS